LKAYDAALIDRSAKMIVETVKNKGGRVSGPIPLPTRIRKYTVLRSPHVDKDSREQFEIRIHKRLVDILDPSAELIAALSELQLPAGVEIEIKQ
jgi:small subunit ribosomal protein S10